jgi:hypothetical protein
MGIIISTYPYGKAVKKRRFKPQDIFFFKLLIERRDLLQYISN